MRISRRKRPQKPLIPKYKKNTEIQAEQVLLLDEEGKNIGVLSKREALDLALEKELDLVEINPKSDPPVVKLIDFTEFKYQKEKEVRKQKAHSKESGTKGVRLSIRISDHDKEIKQKQAEKFLKRGDKVKIELMMKGRENIHGDLATDIVREFITLIGKEMDIKTEQEPTRQGKKIIALIARK